jgi:hypothetical protein
VVGNADLGYPIDLQAMSEAAPACCKYFPELFPGLECKIWLTPDYKCSCGKGRTGTKFGGGNGSQRKCSCVVKLLLFKTGCLVITGARRLCDVNAVFFRIKSLLGEFKQLDQRFYRQLGTMLTAVAPEKTTRKDLKPDVAVACVLSGINPLVNKNAAAAPSSSSMSPFMQMALAGRIEVIKTLFLMDPDAADERDEAGRTTLERLQQLTERTPEQTQIMEMLKEVKGFH